MGTLSPTHWFVIALLFITLFGAKRLPDAARSMGRSLRILKTEMQEMNSEAEAPADPASGQPVPRPAPPEMPSGAPTELRKSRAS